MLLTKAVAGIALFAGLVVAHPGHSVQKEGLERREFLESIEHRSLAHCTEELKALGVEARNIARRQAIVQQARRKRSLQTRGYSTLLRDHNKSGQGYTPSTDPAKLFAGYNSCILAPESIQGPYYVGGENVRKNVVEGQRGVPLLLDYQVVDTRTCKPVENVYVEIWSCNATGVYSGVVASGNGNTGDRGNIDNTWLRGIHLTNKDGVAEFETIFPGHYTGRTAHVHILVHTDGVLLANNTLGKDSWASHIGQAYFDQALINQVERLAPYTSNRQPLTTNAQDFIFQQDTAATGVDPIMEYTLLGNRVEDGLFAWLALGINPTRAQPIVPAGWHFSEGGVANPGGIGPGPRPTRATTSTFVHPTSSSTSTAPPASTTSSPPGGGDKVPHWGQCGGRGYTGPTECEAPYKCVYGGEWWSSCQ
ncbi:hypothetical protein VTI74DRAFT_2030 [Chaetomium olivicolor]